jgi:hypothetical protein
VKFEDPIACDLRSNEESSVSEHVPEKSVKVNKLIASEQEKFNAINAIVDYLRENDQTIGEVKLNLSLMKKLLPFLKRYSELWDYQDCENLKL